MWKNGIAIVALLLVIGWGIYDYSQSKKEQSRTATQTVELEDVDIGIQKGNQAPNFILLDLEGNEVELSDFIGKKVILNFWATWCPPCRAEMPHMEKIYKKNSKEVVVLAINLTNTEKSNSDVQKFVEDFKLSFPVALDTEGEISGQYQIFAYPTSLMIDSQGVIQEIYRGAINEDLMKKSIAGMN
ncbi:redoxin domain-containing protein [Paenibacillus tritici]|uniref:redoxin domain-containing protein n=1 Tax=Paenibacillus tritici TaxID=1873425 RepID=UPI001BADA0FB|nr:redoxin domain-containing protein [Paenibacillus tritici]QUL53497.1 redoxin domain-containing protein [Paenibacillus tritici]